MDPFNWVCPLCEHAGTVTDQLVSDSFNVLNIENATGNHALVSRFTVCPNPKCRKYVLDVFLCETRVPTGGDRYVLTANSLWRRRLVPWGPSRNFPNFVPQVIRDDYQEACAIVELSPKAAATLARRAVQGIIRDYWKIVDRSLNLELEKLRSLIGTEVTQETWDGIDAVRTVGNIGAHMEKDINLIVEVDADEARLLITLVETLVDDTYIARWQREQHRQKLLDLKTRTQVDRKKPANPPD